MVMQAQDIRVNYSGVPDGNVQVSEPASKASGRFGETVVREGNSRIVVEPRYAFCLNFVDCEQCTVSNLTIGHTTGGHCTGGVVGITRGRNNIVIDCDLYGCGAYGLQLNGTQNFSLYSSKIREFMLLGCAIYHPTENLGTMNFCEQPSASQPNFFFPNPYDQDLPSRGIGPDSVDRNGKGE